jgi:hypothetical protein
MKLNPKNIAPAEIRKNYKIVERRETSVESLCSGVSMTTDSS